MALEIRLQLSTYSTYIKWHFSIGCTNRNRNRVAIDIVCIDTKQYTNTHTKMDLRELFHNWVTVQMAQKGTGEVVQMK